MSTFFVAFTQILQNVRQVVVDNDTLYSVLDFINIACGRQKGNNYAELFLRNNKLDYNKHKLYNNNNHFNVKNINVLRDFINDIANIHINSQ